VITQRDVRKLLIKYRDTVQALKKLGIIKTSNVVSGYGEYVAMRKLGLKLQKTGNKGFDGVDKNGKKYEIKSRKATEWNNPTVFPMKKDHLKYFDYLVYTGFDDDWNLIHLLKIPRSSVKPNMHNRVIVNQELIRKFDILETTNRMKPLLK